MANPVLYYIRHGETDWNLEGRLQGQRDVALNGRGRAQASNCAAILRDLAACDGRDLAQLDFVSSSLIRARETMEIIRTALGLNAGSYRVEPRLQELAFGRWEGFTVAELRATDPKGVAERERNKWSFVPPGGESYEMLSVRIAQWYASVVQDSVVVAHGGAARALVKLLGIASSQTAPLLDIDQGVVYRFEGGKMGRYG